MRAQVNASPGVAEVCWLTGDESLLLLLLGLRSSLSGESGVSVAAPSSAAAAATAATVAVLGKACRAATVTFGAFELLLKEEELRCNKVHWRKKALACG